MGERTCLIHPSYMSLVIFIVTSEPTTLSFVTFTIKQLLFVTFIVMPSLLDHHHLRHCCHTTTFNIYVILPPPLSPRFHPFPQSMKKLYLKTTYTLIRYTNTTTISTYIHNQWKKNILEENLYSNLIYTYEFVY